MATSTPAYVAKVKELAESASSQSNDNAMVARDVLERIQNCLRRATHPGTHETEAQTTLRMASRLMEKYNVSQAELIAAEVDSEESSHRGGQSTVNVCKTKPSPKIITTAWLEKSAEALQEQFDNEITFETWKQALEEAVQIAGPSNKVTDKTWLAHIEDFNEYCEVIAAHTCRRHLMRYIVSALRQAEPSQAVKGETWSDCLSEAMQMFFDCKCYTVSYGASRAWVFYGIAVNTIAAAMAFEMAFNLVENWVLSVKSGKSSYRLGVADGLLGIARGEKEDELRRARQQEAANSAAAAANQYEQKCPDLNDGTSAETQSDQHEDLRGSKKTDIRVKCEDVDDVLLKIEDQGQDAATFLEQELSVVYDKDEKHSNDQPLVDVDGTYDYESDEDQAYPGPASTFVAETEKPIDLSGDFDEELLHNMPKQAIPQRDCSLNFTNGRTTDADRAQRITDEESGVLWRDAGTIIRWRKDSNKIADDYLNGQNIKMRTDRKRTARARDPDAYNQGREDSKKIDVKRRRIQGIEDEEM